MRGQIVKIISNLYTVQVGQEKIECRARGKFRQDEIVPLVGDYCKIDVENKYILEILPRQNSLSRPAIANVDYTIIMTSVKSPDLSLSLLDKMLSIMVIHNIEPIICFSKLDLLTKPEKKEFKKLQKYYQKIGYKVFLNTDKRKIMKTLKHKLVVITGQTGAGKSTFLNSLNKELHLKTDEISTSLNRGKHTTRHVEIYAIKDFFVADTPGFSSLDFVNVLPEQIRDSFLEFRLSTCGFKDCFHKGETNCSIKEKVQQGLILKSRYDNYLNFINKR